MIDRKKIREHALKLVIDAEEVALAHINTLPHPSASNNNIGPHGVYSVAEYTDYIRYMNDPSRWDHSRL